MRSAYVLPLQIRRLEDGRFLGRSSRLPGLNVEADSIEDVIRLAPKVARALIAAMREKGVPLPARLTASRSSLSVQLLVSA